jgi:ribosomal protein S18 acetylase RimI-like enzyme
MLASPKLDDYRVYFSRSLRDPLPLPVLPAGYTIRSLQDVSDIDAYQALYGFAKVNPRHQQELVESSEYWHLVMANPSGEWIAYCECSVWFDEWALTNQRIGWIGYVEVAADDQRKGLGSAMLLAGLSKLQELGAESVFMFTTSANLPAINLYQKLGFEILAVPDQPVYEKQFSCPGLPPPLKRSTPPEPWTLPGLPSLQTISKVIEEI